MYWSVLSKGPFRGQEFKWFSCEEENGKLTEKIPDAWPRLKGFIAPNYSSLAIVKNESSLFLVVTNLISSHRRDFASRAIHTHLVLETNQEGDMQILYRLAAKILEKPDGFRKKIDEIVTFSDEKSNKGRVVERNELNKKLGEYWDKLKVNIGNWSDFDKSIKNIIESDEVKLSPSLRDDGLFFRKLKEFWDYTLTINNEDNQEKESKKILKTNFIHYINEIINYLEIGFIVNEKQLYGLIKNEAGNEVNNDGNVDLPERKIAKNHDKNRKTLANRLKTSDLVKGNGILIVCTGHISPEKYVHLPDIKYVLSEAEESDDWRDLIASQEEQKKYKPGHGDGNMDSTRLSDELINKLKTWCTSLFSRMKKSCL